MVSRRSTVVSTTLLIVAVLLALVGVAAPAGAQAPTPVVVYDSTYGASLPPNVPSQPFQAQQTFEFGDEIGLAGTQRALTSVTVTMSDWAQAWQWESMITAKAGDGWTDDHWIHPITLNIYRRAAGNVPGSLIDSRPIQATIPFRPEGTVSCPEYSGPGSNGWKAPDGKCYNGFAFDLTFDLSADPIPVPDRIILGIVFDTQTYGASPMGQDGPWNSLNVGVNEPNPLNTGGRPTGIVSAGTDIEPDAVFWNTTTAGWYSDGGTAGVGIFRRDTEWLGYTPLFKVEAVDQDATTKVIRPGVMQGWAFLNDNAPLNPATGHMIEGPATPPEGDGSAAFALVGATDGQVLAGPIALPPTNKLFLSDLTEISYSTYRSSVDSGNNLAVALQFNVDYDVTDGNTAWQGRLVYEPYSTYPGAVDQDQWATWDAKAGKWFATNAAGAPCIQSNPCTLDQILSLFPNAGISATQPAVVLKAGSNWAGFEGAVDVVTLGVLGVNTTYDFEPGCWMDCYVSPSGDDSNDGASWATAKKTIQAAIDAVQPTGTVHVNDGTYAESPQVGKSVTLTSENGAALTHIQLQENAGYLGALAISGADVDVNVNGFTISGYNAAAPLLASDNILIGPSVGDVTITNNVFEIGARDGGSNNDDGVGIGTYYAVDPGDEVDSVKVSGNTFRPLDSQAARAFYINPRVTEFEFTDNVILGDFTKCHCTEAATSEITGNTVTGPATAGALGVAGYAGPDLVSATFSANTISKVPVAFLIVDANDVTIEHNFVSQTTTAVQVATDDTPGVDLSGVQVHDNSFDVTGPLRASNDLTQPVDLSNNWWGNTDVAASDVAGPVDYTPILTDKDDQDLGAAGFQGSLAHLKVHNFGAQIGTEGRIQEGIDTTTANGIVDVAPDGGTPYLEKATKRDPYTDVAIPGYQFGLFFPNGKPGVSIRGVTDADAVITDPTATQARIETNATNSFGYSGIFVAGDDSTVQGLEIGTNLPSSNKTFEVIADGFSLLDSFVNDDEGAVYIAEFPDPIVTPRIATYHVDGNRFAKDNGVSIVNGAGHGFPGDLDNRTITNNVFVGADLYPHISFRGAGGRAWYRVAVGGATIEDNTFGPADINIRATGTYDESEFHWADWRQDNDYTRLVWVEDGSNAGELRTFQYDTFTNARQLGGRIDQRSDANQPAGVQIADPGDTVHVHSGTYPEQAIIDKAITVDGYGSSLPVVDDGGTNTGTGITIDSDDVVLSDIAVTGYETGVRLTGGSDSLLSGVTIRDVEATGNSTYGLFASAIAGLSDITIQGGVYSGNGPVSFARGIAIWDGPKTDISITGVTASDNRLVGIDINDGSVTGLTITGNTVSGNGDSGIGVLGATTGGGANLIANNTVTNNGRYGIEVKNSTGSGASSGAGSLVVSGNTVSRTQSATDLRDHAGIAVFRRSPDLAHNADQPSGVVVTGNIVTGYRADAAGSTGEGFGIVVEGTGNTVTKNTVSGNDVGIQAQAANPSINAQSTPWFDRGDAGEFGGSIIRNSIAGNEDGLRAVGLTSNAAATCNWWGDASGPSGEGDGSGDSVSTLADFGPWLTSSDLSGGCEAVTEETEPAAVDGDVEGTEFVSSGSFDQQLASVSADIGEAVLDGTDGAWTWSLASDDEDNDGLDPAVPTVVTITATALNGTTATSTFSFTITNVAPTATLVVPTVVAGEADYEFSLTAPVDPATADVNAGFTYTFTCEGDTADVVDNAATCTAPAAPAEIEVVARITDKDGGYSEYTATIKVVDELGVIITPSEHDFGNHVVGAPLPPEQIFTITNNTNSSYTIYKAGFFVTATNQFVVANTGNDCDGTTLAPTAECSFTVVFTPQTTGLQTSSVNALWVGTQPDPRPVATIQGTGVAAPVAAVAIDPDDDPALFGPTPVGLTAIIPFKVTNEGGDPGSVLHVNSVTIVGSGTFTLDPAPITNQDLDEDDELTFDVIFTPTVAGVRQATLIVNTNVGNVTLTLRGTGTVPVPAATVSTESLTFGPQDVDAGPTAAQAITLTNEGDAGSSVTITSITKTGSLAFAVVTDDCDDNAPLAKDAACDIEVTYDPSAVGEHHGTIKIVTNAGTFTVALKGTADPVPPVTAAVAKVTPAGYNFSDTVVGATRSKTFTVTNTGDAAMVLTTAAITGGDAADFAIDLDDCDGETIPVGSSSCTIKVTFAPGSVGSKSANLVVASDASNSPVTVPLTGEAIAAPPAAPQAAFHDDSDSADFGEWLVNEAPGVTHAFVVTNTGATGSVLKVNGIEVSGAAAFQLVSGSDCVDANLDVDDTCTIEVTFLPGGTGQKNATLIVRTNDGTLSKALTGTGIAPKAAIDPTERDYGQVVANGTPKSRTFKVTNTGSADLVIGSASIGGSNSGQFPLGTDGCSGQTLTPGAECTIQVSFAPTGTGSRTATLTVPSNAATVTASLEGEGIAAPPAPQAVIKITPAGYNFSDTVAGSGSRTKVFTVKNTGDAALAGLDIQVTGAAAFTKDITDCGGALGAGAECSVTVRFQPGTVGPKAGTLTVSASNADPKVANLTGEAVSDSTGPTEPIAKVTPDEGDFGSRTVGTNTGMTFTLKNVGSATLTITSVAITGSSFVGLETHEDYTCDTVTSLAPNATCGIRVRFSPTSTGVKTGKLKIVSNATNGNVIVPLEGTGTPAPSDVTVSPNPYDFGDTAFKTTKSKTFTITNNGGASAKVTSIAKSGANPGRFTILAADDDCTGITLAGGGGSCQFKVQYKATDSTGGSHSADISITGTGFPGTTLAVSGTSAPRIVKIDGRISNEGDVAAKYVGAGIFCTAGCDAQTVSTDVKKGKTFNYRVRIKNSGNAKDDIRVRLTQSGSKAIVDSIKILRNGNQDVTTKVMNGTYVVKNVNPGSGIYFWVQIKLKSNASVGKVNHILLSGQSGTTTSVKDVVRGKTKAIN